MSTTLDSVSQTPRKSSRPTKKNQIAQANAQSTPNLPTDAIEPFSSPSTPPASRPQNLNATQNLANGVESNGGDNTTRKKKPKSAKKPAAQSQTPGYVSDGPAKHRPTSGQYNAMASDTTPAKFAYAGPTFHNSPAPTALPLPSIFSKSVPDIAAPNLEHFGSEDEGSTPEEGSPSRPNPQNDRPIPEREASPLDFIFNAARQAKASPRTETPNGVHLETPPTAEKPRNHERHHSSGGGMFPFEADAPGSTPRPIGPAFATPYKDRMNALRSSNSPMNTNQQQLDEEQRRAKSEALKKFLFSQTPQRPASASPRLHDQANPFDSATYQQVAGPPAPNGYRHASGPSPPRSSDSPQNAQQRPRNPLADFPLLQQSLSQGSPRNPTPSSNLRQEVQPTRPYAHAELPTDSPGYAPSPFQHALFQDPAMQSPSQHFTRSSFPQHNHINGQSATVSSGTASAKPTSEEMADQMRRFLKLNPVAK